MLRQRNVVLRVSSIVVRATPLCYMWSLCVVEQSSNDLVSSSQSCLQYRLSTVDGTFAH